jgi:hypothetical protein
MSGIRGAFISDAELAAIDAYSSTVAREIRTLLAVLGPEGGSADDFVRLCKLLYQSGDSERAEALLRANSNGNDLCHEAYRELFGTDAEVLFSVAVRTLEQELQVQLKRKRVVQFLVVEYECSDVPKLSFSQTSLSFSSARSYGVTVSYTGLNTVVADLYETDDLAANAIPLQFVNGNWVMGQQ